MVLLSEVWYSSSEVELFNDFWQADGVWSGYSEGKSGVLEKGG